MPHRDPGRALEAHPLGLAAAGYITRERIGQRNQYTINAHLPIPDPTARNNVGALLELLAGTQDGQPDDRSETTA